MVRRTAAGAAVGTLLTVCVTGCLGGGGDKASEGDSSTAKGDPSAVEALSVVSGKSGTIKSFHATISMTTSQSGPQMTMNGNVLSRTDPPAAKVDFSAVTSPDKNKQIYQEVLLGDTLYLRVPALFGTTVGKPWMKFPFTKLIRSEDTDDMGPIDLWKQADPSLSVKLLSASRNVRKVGNETVGGVSTTHYQGTYATRDALAKLDDRQRDQVEEAIGQSGLDTMAFDLWVDGEQLPRKIRMTTPQGAKLRMDTTFAFSDFNAPVSVAPPPATQVVDGGDLQDGTSRG